MRVRLSRGFWTSRLGLCILGVAGFLFLVGAGTCTYFYVSYSRLIEQRLGGAVFTSTSRVFAAPPRVYAGQPLSQAELTAYLQRVGYTDSEVVGEVGRFKSGAAFVEIYPLAQSYFSSRNALRVDFAGAEIVRIRAVKGNETLASAEIEPELITSLFDSSREKRRFIRFADAPGILIDAVRSAEDKRFFEHPGFDPISVLRAGWAHLTDRNIKGGASTITMQVARSFFFDTRREWRRKVAETFMALLLEQRFSKQQIFELYLNEVYLGNRGSFAIHGFGEGTQAYFGKDIREISLSEAAFLAGIIRAPNRYANVERHADRATGARDRVLGQMVENKLLTGPQAEEAKKASWKFANLGRDASAAPYFVDMVRDHVLEKLDETELTKQSYRIYTTLDPDLQRAAAEAVAIGAQEIDKQLAKKYDKWRKARQPVPLAQVAMIALDPRTGEIKALVGGRDYGQSQLNHVLARRQPGSVFKPFVYTAAFESAVDGATPLLTPISTVDDSPTTFLFEDKEYSPNNYGAEYHGTVTLRSALRQSLNVATVKVAEMVGYARVVSIAQQMGLDPSIKATPAVALGAYEMSPKDVAAAYTIFATGGARAEPWFIRSVVRADGSQVERTLPNTRAALDPRVAYVVTNLMEDVINRGTAAGVRGRGFTAPAAGKTGTSHDGWFAGFTSNLVCVVWVGFDDNRELGLSGASAAAPLWTEFMKRAVQLPAYRNTVDFLPPEGVSVVTLDPDTLELATTSCPATVQEVFLMGSEPTHACSKHGGGMRTAISAPVNWLSGIFGTKDKPPVSNPQGTPAPAKEGPSPQAPGAQAGTPAKSEGAPAEPHAPPAEKDDPKKKGVFSKIFGIFGGKKEKEKAKPEPPPKPPSH